YMNTRNSLKNKNIFVTGGTGFIGSHVVEELLDCGANVFVLSRSFAPRGYFMRQNLHARATLVFGDVKDADRIFDVVTRYEISLIVHLAAQPLVVSALINPRETLETNIMGTVNVLEAARKSPWIEGVIVASSDKAYGKLERPYTEDDPLMGDHPYEVSKSSADLIAKTYAKTYDLPVVVTRFGNVYGEGDLNPSRVIPGIFFSLLNNQPFQIRSNGMYKRAYVYVKDVARGYSLIAERVSEYKGHAFNFGSDDVYSVLDLIHLFETKLGIEIQYKILNTAVNEIPVQSLSYDKAKQLLSWRPSVRLSDVAKSLYEWYSSNGSGNHAFAHDGMRSESIVFSFS
ncbi:MAG: GDP-mannose 4,6-dehydratase, partial [Patescibacteria group bacterium]|nr:GDP-mannose 4,6-dehydratase [Patescibacteria group bacterium]